MAGLASSELRQRRDRPFTPGGGPPIAPGEQPSAPVLQPRPPPQHASNDMIYGTSDLALLAKVMNPRMSQAPMTLDEAVLKVQAAWRANRAMADVHERVEFEAGDEMGGQPTAKPIYENPAYDWELVRAGFKEACIHCFNDRRVLVAMFGITLFQTFTIVAFLLSLALFIDDLTTTATDGASAVVDNTTVISMAVLSILIALLDFAKSLLLEWAGTKLTRHMRTILADTIMLKPLWWFEDQVEADLIDGVGGDVTHLVENFFKNMVLGWWNSCMVLVGFTVMGIVDRPSMAIALFIVPVLAAGAFFQSQFVGRFVLKHRLATTSCNIEIAEFIHNIRTIRSYAMEIKEIDDYKNSVREAALLHQKMAVSDTANGLVMGVLSASCLTFLLWFEGHQVSQAKISVGRLIGSLFLATFNMYYLNQICRNVLNVIEGLDHGNTILALARDYYSDQDEDVSYMFSGVPAEFASESRGEIAFMDVYMDGLVRPGYNYLQDFTVTIEAGSVMAFVGSASSGRDNIPLLLKRLYRPDAGSIFIDGRNIDDYDQSLQSKVGWLNSDPVLVRGSVGDNVLYGCKQAVTREDIIKACKQADAHRFIMQLPKGYDTVIGEGKTNVSLSQSVRIVMARVFLRDPPIVILDNPMAGITDTLSVNRVTASLRRVLRNPVRRTGVVIAHNLDDVLLADNVAAVTLGRVVDVHDRDTAISNPELAAYKILEAEGTTLSRMTTRQGGGGGGGGAPGIGGLGGATLRRKSTMVLRKDSMALSGYKGGGGGSESSYSMASNPVFNGAPGAPAAPVPLPGQGARRRRGSGAVGLLNRAPRKKAARSSLGAGDTPERSPVSLLGRMGTMASRTGMSREGYRDLDSQSGYTSGGMTPPRAPNLRGMSVTSGYSRAGTSRESM